MIGNSAITIKLLFIPAQLIFFLSIFVISTPSYSQNKDEIEWLLDKLAETESASNAAVLRKNIWTLWHDDFSIKKRIGVKLMALRRYSIKVNLKKQ